MYASHAIGKGTNSCSIEKYDIQDGLSKEV